MTERGALRNVNIGKPIKSYRVPFYVIPAVCRPESSVYGRLKIILTPVPAPDLIQGSPE
jgi:hypothetical protein